MDQDESDLVFVLDAPSVGDNSKHLGSKKARPELATMCLSGTPKISNSKRFQIQGSYEVHVRNVGLVFDHHHRLELERISSKVVFTGNISCSECANQTRSSSMKSELSPALFSIKAWQVRRLILHEVNAEVPLKLTALDGFAVVVSKSRFETIPWPGFYIHNVTRVRLNHNQFIDAAPKAVLAKQGTEVVVANNVLDVSSAMDVSQFQHMTIRCNRPNLSSPVPPSLQCKGVVPPDPTFIDEFYLSLDLKYRIIMWGIIGTFDIFGFFWIPLVALLTILASILVCCCCRKCQDDFWEEELPPESLVIVHDPLIPPKARPPILKKRNPEGPHINGHDNSVPDPPEKYDTFVKIDKVTEEPDPEEGVVHGHLFLTGSWPNNVKRLRAMSDGEEDAEEEADGPQANEPLENPGEEQPTRPKRSSGLKTISEVRLPEGYIPPETKPAEDYEDFPKPKPKKRVKNGPIKKVKAVESPSKTKTTAKTGAKGKANTNTSSTKKSEKSGSGNSGTKRDQRESSVGRYTTV
ncbi:hypothetical protein TCAL_12770 [Tigriopus californicus]|uniref:Uncharacterized protein n=1 Tax=Tigriopus californicus TaxID=6832 RepID=A0A553PQE5_TIGCA|nr:hypothetical protein TCAL_12770 [Tigriopus californicus]